MEFNEHYKLSEINKEQFNFLNYCYSIIVHKSRTYNEIEKNINLLKNDKIIYILKFGFGIGNGIESFDIYNFHLRWLFCNNSIISDNNELNQFEKDYNLGYKYFEDNFKKVAPDVNHIEMLIDNFNNEWKQKLTTVYVADKGLIKNSYYDNGFLNAYIEYEKNHKYLFEKISNTIEPQQTETIKNADVTKELHSHIFKNNAFEVWQSMFDEFEINESSRTDVKFMFEELKKEGLIHNTVNQKTFLEWITPTYNGLIVQKISNHSRTKKRLQAYSRAKQLYKE